MLTIDQRKELLKLAEAHQAADEFRQGDATLCSVGCSVSDAMRLGIVPQGDPCSHATIAKLWGVPETVARLFDVIFEGLPRDEAMAWTPRWQRVLLENPDADHSLVWPKFAMWLLTDAGLLTITDGNREAIAAVAGLYRRTVAGEVVTAEEWQAAWAAAEASAEASARAAAEASAWAAARAARAAWAAAWAAAEAAAEAAAWAAAEASTEASARAVEAAWRKMADKLCELLAAREGQS